MCNINVFSMAKINILCIFLECGKYDASNIRKNIQLNQEAGQTPFVQSNLIVSMFIPITTKCIRYIAQYDYFFKNLVSGLL